MTNKKASSVSGRQAAKKKPAPQAATKKAASKVAPKAAAVKKPTKAQAEAAAKKLAEAFPTQPEAQPARATKKQQAIDILRDGATLPEMMERFGWLRHTTRGFLSILGKTHTLKTFKNEAGVHTYRLAV